MVQALHKGEVSRHDLGEYTKWGWNFRTNRWKSQVLNLVCVNNAARKNNIKRLCVIWFNISSKHYTHERITASNEHMSIALSVVHTSNFNRNSIHVSNKVLFQQQGIGSLQSFITIWIPTILVQKVPKLWVSSPKTLAPSTQDCWNQDQNRYRWNAKISPATHPGLWHLPSEPRL